MGPVAEPGEGPGPGPPPPLLPLFLDQTKARRAEKTTPTPLSQGLDDRPAPPPLSENLDPPLGGTTFVERFNLKGNKLHLLRF